jgi:hypothetical protein
MVFIFDGEPSAFWMSHCRLYFVQSAFNAFGSAVTQRGEDVVSGRMMPTFAPLPSIAPELLDEDEVTEEEPPAGWLVTGAGELLLPPPPLEPQAASVNAAMTPIAATGTLLVRMQ